MFAIIRTNGKQYRVAQGDTVRLARISAEPGDAFETDQVLAIGGEESELKFGSPVIAGAKVQGTVLEHGKDKKVIVFKRKRRKTYRRKYGHRQAHTMVKIEKISAKAPAAKKTVSEKAAAPKTAVKKAAPKKESAPKTTVKKAAVKKA
ncbi:MAG: 50S ribosomal protein L21 [SAR324 cluster bacterium]|nr:50S ribosomal protein L21 [SAR324 cluster bacterium]MBL7035996.1 50S ribosomal protein L21 [SAR324 cluster bacterium]